METLTEDRLKQLFDVAMALSDEAGRILIDYWGKLREVTDKGTAGNLVTEADKGAEKAMIDLLSSFCPTHAVLGEETGSHQGKDAEFLWVIDPLDGTTNYVHNYPMFAVSIALLYKKVPVIGIVYNPLTDEKFCAMKGRGAVLNGQRLSVSATAELERSLLASGFAYDVRESNDTNFPEFCRLTALTQGVRRAGSAALDLAYVACGRIDGYWEKGINPWDIAAGVLLVTEAGGKVTDYDGGRIDLYAGRVLATNGKIHGRLSEVLFKVAS